MTVAVIDIVFFALMFLSGIHGSRKGFIAEIFSKAAFVLGVISAVSLYSVAASALVKNGANLFVANISGFFLIFIAVFLIVKVAEKLLAGLFSGSILGGLNHALGFFLGMFEGLLIAAVILVILYIQPVFDASAILENSVFHKLLHGVLSAPVRYVSQITVAALNCQPSAPRAAGTEIPPCIRCFFRNFVFPQRMLHV
ncbi:MAG: CvpA family protein [Bacteroides sp.]|nr:CvpA family protein [Prevotella sp.]MCM1408295.1 CvpA family protein [Treponema brennaborense]MCM1470473.1 CvpA family protein [Bacteroides sp.]